MKTNVNLIITLVLSIIVNVLFIVLASAYWIKIRGLNSEVMQLKTIQNNNEYETLAISQGLRELQDISDKNENGQVEEAIYFGHQLEEKIKSVNDSIHNDTLQNYGKVKFPIENVEVALYHQLAEAYYRLDQKENSENSKEVVQYARQILELDSSYWIGYRYLALGLWRSSRSVNNIDINEIEFNFSKSLSLNDKYNVDAMNICEFYFTTSQFNKAIESSTLAINMHENFGRQSQPSNIEFMRDISSYINTKNESHTKLLKKNINSIPKLSDEIRPNKWGDNFVNDFYINIETNEKIPESKKKFVQSQMKRFYSFE